MLGRLHDADHRNRFETEFAHRFRGAVELTFAAVDHDQIGQRFAFFKQPAITPRHYFAHRGNIIHALDAANAKLAILSAVHLAVVANDHAGDVLRALNVRDVKRLDARWEVRQLE